jgi:hypothetical protein
VKELSYGVVTSVTFWHLINTLKQQINLSWDMALSQGYLFVDYSSILWWHAPIYFKLPVFVLSHQSDMFLSFLHRVIVGINLKRRDYRENFGWFIFVLAMRHSFWTFLKSPLRSLHSLRFKQTLLYTPVDFLKNSLSRKYVFIVNLPHFHLITIPLK